MNARYICWEISYSDNMCYLDINLVSYFFIAEFEFLRDFVVVCVVLISFAASLFVISECHCRLTLALGLNSNIAWRIAAGVDITFSCFDVMGPKRKHHQIPLLNACCGRTWLIRATVPEAKSYLRKSLHGLQRLLVANPYKRDVHVR